jgi:hypothetical protein
MAPLLGMLTLLIVTKKKVVTPFPIIEIFWRQRTHDMRLTSIAKLILIA